MKEREHGGKPDRLTFSTARSQTSDENEANQNLQSDD